MCHGAYTTGKRAGVLRQGRPCVPAFLVPQVEGEERFIPGSHTHTGTKETLREDVVRAHPFSTCPQYLLGFWAFSLFIFFVTLFFHSLNN